MTIDGGHYTHAIDPTNAGNTLNIRAAAIQGGACTLTKEGVLVDEAAAGSWEIDCSITEQQDAQSCATDRYAVGG